MQDMARPSVRSTFDKRYLRPDGSSVWCEMNIRPLMGADGAVAGFLTQAVDITARKLAEAPVRPNDDGSTRRSTLPGSAASNTI